MCCWYVIEWYRSHWHSFNSFTVINFGHLPGRIKSVCPAMIWADRIGFNPTRKNEKQKSCFPELSTVLKHVVNWTNRKLAQATSDQNNKTDEKCQPFAAPLSPTNWVKFWPTGSFPYIVFFSTVYAYNVSNARGISAGSGVFRNPQRTMPWQGRGAPPWIGAPFYLVSGK